MAKNLTRAKAEKALAQIEKQFGVTAAEKAAGYGPTLMENFEGNYDTYRWAIVWEGGPYEWTYGAFEAHTGEYGRMEGVTRPAKVYAEAINHYALALYRDDDLPEHTPKTWAEIDAEMAPKRAQWAAEKAAREAAEADKVMGVRAHIYRWSLGECSNGGISSRVNAVTVVGPNVPRVTEATPDAPAVELTETVPGYVVAQPVEHSGGVGPMAGGTFVYSSDSRFPVKHPIPLHDRFETAAEYALYSS